MRKHFIVIFLVVFSLAVNAQLSVGLTLGGIDIHQGNSQNAKYYKLKFNKKGRFAAFLGATLSISYRINDFIGIKMVQSVLPYDSAGKPAGVTHFGVEFHDDILGFESDINQFSLSLGPFWYYRKNWSELAGYTNDPAFIKMDDNGVWEKKFVWFGGFINYKHQFDQKNAFSIDFLPGYPHLYALSAGLAYNR